MPIIRISAEAHEAIRANARPGAFRDYSQPAPGGARDVPLDEDTLARIEKHRQLGETLSDTIVRLASMHATGGKAH